MQVNLNGCIFFALDVTNLSLNISHDEASYVIWKFLEKVRRGVISFITKLIDLLDVVLKFNDFRFNGKTF